MQAARPLVFASKGMELKMAGRRLSSSVTRRGSRSTRDSKRRLAKAPRPWLRVEDVPKNAGIPDEEQAKVVDLMCNTKFGHPDRYKDRVSILRAMKQSNKTQAVAISVTVGFKSSPREWAQKLVKADSCKFKELVAGESNGSAYEQTGCSKKDLSKGGSGRSGSDCRQKPLPQPGGVGNGDSDRDQQNATGVSRNGSHTYIHT